MSLVSPSPRVRFSPFFAGGALALFNATVLGVTLACTGRGAAELVAPQALGEPAAAVELARMLISAATLAAIYEFDARTAQAAPRVMRIATEVGVISAALMFASAVLAFQLVASPTPLEVDRATVIWLARALGLAAMPGLGVWALVAATVGFRSGRLPMWVGFAGAEMAATGALAFVLPQLTVVFVAVLFAFWVGVSQFFARADRP